MWALPDPGDRARGLWRRLRHRVRPIAASGPSRPVVFRIPLSTSAGTSNGWLTATPMWKIGDVPSLCCVYLSALNATLARRAIPVNAGLCVRLINGRARRSGCGGFGRKSRTRDIDVRIQMTLVMEWAVRCLPALDRRVVLGVFAAALGTHATHMLPTFPAGASIDLGGRRGVGVSLLAGRPSA